MKPQSKRSKQIRECAAGHNSTFKFHGTLLLKPGSHYPPRFVPGIARLENFNALHF